LYVSGDIVLEGEAFASAEGNLCALGSNWLQSVSIFVIIGHSVTYINLFTTWLVVMVTIIDWKRQFRRLGKHATPVCYCNYRAKDGSSMFYWNVGIHLPIHTALIN
jgi:hypothetical protein